MGVIMGKILYIKASPMGGRSSSIVAADAFVDAYAAANPDDTMQTLDLFEASLPEFDFAAASAKYKIMHGKEHSQDEKDVWEGIVAVIDEFKAADKYVLAVPMWNVSIPWRLKQYLDILIQPGQTFTVAEDGSYDGLVKDKPIFVVFARGGEYPPGAEAFDHQKPYLELTLGFIGFKDIRSVVVEPTLAAGPETAKDRRAAAIEKAKAMAADF